MIKDAKGNEKVPSVHFCAEDSGQDEIKVDERKDEDAEQDEGGESHMINGTLTKTGKIGKKAAQKEDGETKLRGGPGEGGVETYSGKGREAKGEVNENRFVRWSSSTDIGDFIRDAARGKEFAVEIEGADHDIRVGVPSFNDRTHYLRVRLRKASRQLASLASVKKECDQLAHKSAQRLAMGGFGILSCWWGACYYFTFMTSYGWDTMEPITVSYSFLLFSLLPVSGYSCVRADPGDFLT